jgi:hypothetical protein
VRIAAIWKELLGGTTCDVNEKQLFRKSANIIKHFLEALRLDMFKYVRAYDEVGWHWTSAVFIDTGVVVLDGEWYPFLKRSLAATIV